MQVLSVLPLSFDLDWLDSSWGEPPPFVKTYMAVQRARNLVLDGMRHSHPSLNSMNRWGVSHGTPLRPGVALPSKAPRDLTS